MSDQSQSGAPGGPSAPQTGRWRGRSWLFVATIALAAGLTGAVTSRAVSQHYGHGFRFMGGTFDPARVEEGADRAVRHLAIEINATTDQQEKLRAIVKGAVKDLLPMREKALSARQRGRVLRTEQLALADAASKRFAQALGDTAEVLTPEQRRKIDDRLTELRERRGFWHGWRRG